MNKYHLYTNINDRYQQAFLFNVIHNNDDTLHICELYIITVVNNVECKTRIDFDGMARLMGQNTNGNIRSESLKQVLDSFMDSYDMSQEEIDKIESQRQAEILISANECAMSAHPTNIDIESIVRDRLRKSS